MDWQLEHNRLIDYQIARLSNYPINSAGSSCNDCMTGIPSSPAREVGESPRCSNTPRMPARIAPSTSWRRLSPTITASAGATFTSCSAAEKMLGCGFMKPCSDEDTVAVMSPCSSKCDWNDARQRCELEMRPMRMPAPDSWLRT